MSTTVCLTLVVFCCCFSTIFASLHDARPIVEVKSGKIEGYTASSRDGKVYYGFEAIPFAKPPINALRFKAPEPEEAWNGVRDGSQHGAFCPQMNGFINQYVGDEDCLFLNVYTPQLERDADELYPVLVFIHGGGFLVGTAASHDFGPQKLMDYPIVLVTINYRLGVLGFLNTQDENAVGNFGLLDQVLALKWIQNNVVAFGGDPNAVTIWGVSAGAASVVFHMLSPLSTGLFHRAIAQSGTATCHWALNRDPVEWARGFARHLKCPNYEDSQSLVKCLSDRSAEELTMEEIAFRKDSIGQFFPNYAVPSVEGEGGPGFLTEDPIGLLKAGRIANKVPVMVGLAATEGYTLYCEVAKNMRLRGRRYFEEEFPSHLAQFSAVLPHMSAAHRAILDEYCSNVDLEDEELFHHVGTLINGDATLSADIAQTAELLSHAHLPVYAYIFDHITQRCLAEFLGGKCGKYCSHADEYLLQFVFANVTMNKAEDVKMSNILNGLWTAFASNKELILNEEETWSVYEQPHRHYAHLTLKPGLKQGLLSEKMAFWTEKLPSLMSKKDPKDEL